jgi:predicted nucleic acid-binding Zn ribbon protein
VFAVTDERRRPTTDDRRRRSADERRTPAADADMPAEGGDAPVAETTAAPPRGPELARAVLDAARGRRESLRTAEIRRAGASRGGARRTPRPRGYSGPGPDPRDPQLFSAVLAKLVKARGWQRQAAEGLVFGAWERVVGADVAAHCRPIKLVDGELTVEAESTAWATQLRLLATKLLRQIAAEVGPNVVTRMRIHGPAAPSWSRGLRRIAGRGPRDTYG